MSESGRLRTHSKSFGQFVHPRPSWETTEVEICKLLNREHIGGPGRPDCADEIEIKDHKACISRSAIIEEAEKGRRMIVAQCFSKPAIEEARNRGVQLVQFKRLPFRKTELRPLF